MSSISIEVTGSNEMFGWDVCRSFECVETAKSWERESSIPEASLRETFGTEVTVMRSCGVIQHGWEIRGPAFIGIDPSPEWFINLYLPGEHKRKLVTLEQLELWNQVVFAMPRRIAK